MAESAQLRPPETLTTMSISIDNSFFCPGCNRRFCCCGSEPDDPPLDGVVSRDYADDGPDLWPDDEDELS